MPRILNVFNLLHSKPGVTKLKHTQSNSNFDYLPQLLTYSDSVTCAIFAKDWITETGSSKKGKF